MPPLFLVFARFNQAATAPDPGVSSPAGLIFGDLAAGGNAAPQKIWHRPDFSKLV
jgi:hypothetical protein